MNFTDKQTRKDALKSFIILPALAGALAMSNSVALADNRAGNKKAFKYQDKPGPSGHKCAGCRFFKPPHACKIVSGTISPSGWCVSWVAK